MDFLKRIIGNDKATEKLEDANINTLIDGQLDIEFSQSYVYKMLGGYENEI